MDVAARLLITFGGIGTIVAVMAVALFLVWVVWPLTQPAKITGAALTSAPFADRSPIHVDVDEHQTLGYALLPDGVVHVFALRDGRPLEQQRVTDRTITAASFSTAGGSFVLGYDNGEIQPGTISFQTLFFERDDVPEDLRTLGQDEVRPLRDYALVKIDGRHHRLMTQADAAAAGVADARPLNGAVQLTPQGQLRVQRMVVTTGDPIPLGGQWPVRLVRRVNVKGSPIYVCLDDHSQFQLIAMRKDMFGNVTPKRYSLPYEPRPLAGPPRFLLVTQFGEAAFLAWEDGTVQRYHIRHPAQAAFVESFNALDGPAKLTVFHFVAGGQTVLIGDSAGDLSAWFGYKPDAVGDTPPPEANASGETHHLVMADRIPPAAAAKLRKARPDEIPSELASYAGDLLVNTYPEDVVFTKVHQLPRGPAAVTAAAAASGSRLIAAGYANGQVRLMLVTTAQSLLTAGPLDDASGPVTALAIAPKDNGVIADVNGQIAWWTFNPMHPEASPAALFLPVWYEGYNQPSQTWHASTAADGEMKLGLAPLIFGTLKATFYAMIFAVPLALLAAVYTSEFLHPRAKSKIKPVVEMMASLPSVVLGFLAGMVFAPLIEHAIPTVLAGFITLPVAFLLGAYLWQTLPRAWQIYAANLGVAESKGGGDSAGVRRAARHLIFHIGGVKLLLLMLMLIIGCAAAVYAGPLLSELLFAGDIRQWLTYQPFTLANSNPQYAGGLGGWVALLWPVGAVVTAVLFTRYVNPHLRELGTRMSGPQLALLQLLKFAVGVGCTIVLAMLMGKLLLAVGLDPRGPIRLGGYNLAPVGSYVQNNALVVGVAMGFAVIPIIYTIAEDALSAAPEHLRSAALGCGATPWQTAMTVIIPTAASGLFSACMIGMGRAVGETMIVLMALGSTAVLDMNIFNGARTLSVNIATEMPEAAKNSTHYRVLFLCGLTLFVMTFIVNTIAEAVRQRFRRKNSNL